MSWTRYFKIPVAALLALTLSGCLEDVVPLQVGSPAPPAKLTLLNGDTVELTEHPGKGQIIIFMSSWCPCSNESIPIIKKSYDTYGKGDGGRIAFVMVGIQDPRSKFEAFVEKWQLPFPAGHDDGDEIARNYGVRQPPTFVFVDKSGKVQRFFYGNIKDKARAFQYWVKELL